MSFLASFFAIPISSFPRDSQDNVSWPIRKVSGYLCKYFAFSLLTNADADSVGISVALFVPFLFIAFFVNRISASAKAFIHNIPGREQMWENFIKFVGESEIPIEEDDDHIDEEDESDDDDFEKGPKSKQVIIQELRYARLLGKYTFHKSIPILRTLWRYYPGGAPKEVGRDGTGDYPLHRFRDDTAIFTIKLIRLLLCCFPRRLLPRLPEQTPKLPEHRTDAEPEPEPEPWGYRRSVTIEHTELELESPDYDSLFYSRPISPTPPYSAGDGPIERVSSPTYEAPIASRSLRFVYGQSSASDFAEDYFGGSVRDRNIYVRPLDSHVRPGDMV